MKMEDIRHEFPEMPEEMRIMIKNKVEEQLRNSEGPEGNFQKDSEGRSRALSARNGRKHPKRMAVLILAATIALGTTAFAGSRLYQMYTERAGEYGMKTVVEMGGSSILPGEENVADAPQSEADLTEGNANAETIGQEQDTEAEKTEQTEFVRKYKNAGIKAVHLPEGMVESPWGYSWYYEDEPRIGGISSVVYQLDEDDTFEVVDTDIISSEEIDVNGHEGVYLTRKVYSTGSAFDRIIYVMYPEAELVLQLYVAENVSREDALEFAEGIELVELEDSNTTGEKKISWRDYIADLLQPETEIYTAQMSADREEMANVRAVGEAFALESCAYDANGENIITEDVTAKVTDVQIADDLSLLDPEHVDYYLAAQADEQGNLLPNEIQYVKTGDGIDTTDEVLKTETVAQKLVCVSVEYTNGGDIPLYDILFLGNMMKIQETKDGYKIFDREAVCGGEDCDELVPSGLAYSAEMQYYDLKSSGDHNGSNYIDTLQPGESATVHMAFIVNEDELGYLYLNLCGTGGEYEFTENSLKYGYVDLRQ